MINENYLSVLSLPIRIGSKNAKREQYGYQKTRDYSLVKTLYINILFIDFF